MSFNELILILKARRSIIAVTFSIIVLLATLISFILPKTYEASTSLLLNYKGMDPVTGNILPSQLMPGYMATQIDVITSKNVAKKVVEKLKLTENPTIQAQFSKVTDQGDIKTWLAERLLAGLNVRPSKQSSVIDIVYKGPDPKFVALVANTFAQAYEEVNVQLKVQPAKKAAIFFGIQTNTLKKSLENAQSNLSKYQQEHGITNIDGGLDVEQSKLNELSTQLVVAQGQLFDSKSRNNSSRATGNSPDIASDPLVQNLKVEVSRASAKLKELSEKYGQQHPLYIAAKSELDEQRSLLNTEVRNARGNVNETFNIYQQRVNDIQAALEAQKEKVLKLNLTRDELSGLQNEVLSTEKAMEVASQRFNATLQEASSNQSDLSVLNVAMPPFLPSNPKIKLNILIGIVLGLLLGITFAVIAESRDKRIRSKEDLNKLLDMQIFTISDLDNKGNTKKKLIASKSNRKLLKTA